MSTYRIIMAIIDVLFIAYHVNKSKEFVEWNSLFILFWAAFFFHDIGVY